MSSWDARIDEACAIEDPVMCNVTVTVLHHELSVALRDLIGPDAGANFHSWATWGLVPHRHAGRLPDGPL